MVIGGVAVGLLGWPRFTRDLGAVVLVEEERWPELLADAPRFGLVPRIREALAFAARNRVLLLRHAGSSVEVDVSFSALPFEREAIARATRVRVSGISVPLPTPEDLIIMKAVANRPQDLADIESLLHAHSNLDLRRVRRKVREFARAMDRPAMLADLEGLMIRGRRKRRR